MSNTPPNSRHLQRLAARAHLTPLLLLLTACSGAPVSLGSGLDSQESALTSSDPVAPIRMDTCDDNPLLLGCPTSDATAETCDDNPLLLGCQTSDATAETCDDNPLLLGCPRE